MGLLIPFQIALGARAAALAPAALPAFVVQSQTEMPADLHAAVDVRWASERTVYLALTSRGVVEVPLAPELGAGKEMIAGKRTVGGLFLSCYIAASGDYLAAAPPIYLVLWRRLDQPTRLAALGGMVSLPWSRLTSRTTEPQKLISTSSSGHAARACILNRSASRSAPGLCLAIGRRWSVRHGWIWRRLAADQDWLRQDAQVTFIGA